MTTWKWLAAGLALCPFSALAQDPAAPGGAEKPAAPADAPPEPAKSKVSAVTVYQGNALVTREVAVPGGKAGLPAGSRSLGARSVMNSVTWTFSSMPRNFQPTYHSRRSGQPHSSAISSKCAASVSPRMIPEPGVVRDSSSAASTTAAAVYVVCSCGQFTWSGQTQPVQ